MREGHSKQETLLEDACSTVHKSYTPAQNKMPCFQIIFYNGFFCYLLV